MPKHTSREFERELRTLRDRLLAMGGRAERQVTQAVQAVTTRDAALAQLVIDGDRQIDQDEVEIDEQAFLILARRQPVASDLRFVMMALKVVTDLERIGDMGVNIARRSLELQQSLPEGIAGDIAEMARRVMRNLRSVLAALVNGSADEAEKLIAEDRAIDELNTRIIASVLHGSSLPPDLRGDWLLAISSVSRYLERIGDHGTNIAEMVIYYLRGSDVRHQGGSAREPG